LEASTVKKQDLKRELVVGTAEDHRNHLVVYLFAMLLPFYPIDTGTWRDFAALLSALGFVSEMGIAFLSRSTPDVLR
jgi:hypothetical protein